MGKVAMERRGRRRVCSRVASLGDLDPMRPLHRAFPQAKFIWRRVGPGRNALLGKNVLRCGCERDGAEQGGWPNNADLGLASPGGKEWYMAALFRSDVKDEPGDGGSALERPGTGVWTVGDDNSLVKIGEGAYLERVIGSRIFGVARVRE